ncbi:MAG TPA: alkaline phosphatase family protein [Thermoanaerobaculia bacterium]|nr:alkaline phosphatase family protein [Thermoanaerobaculia bacterium]
MSEVDSLRQQLKERGYLSHGIERWFALDPWSSRAFWLELATVALKAATLIAAFGALPLTAVMLFRNFPLRALETLELFATYAAAWLVFAFAFVVLVALILKVRPALPIDTPRALLAISLAASALLVAPVAAWWYGFDTAPPLPELAIGVALMAVFFLISTIVVSAALLSFSIYELQRVPAIHAKPRGLPMAVAAVVLIAMLFVPAYVDRDRVTAEPMVVTTPTSLRIALIAVDGLTHEILQSRPDLLRLIPNASRIPPLPADSTTERWASLGTGVPTEAHGVRAIEGVRFLGATHILQRISRGDVVLMNVAPALRIARREPLPPTVRRRDYVWEIVTARGLPAVSVNWWTTSDVQDGALQAVGPESVFTTAKGEALRVDATATARFLTLLDERNPRFATVYLPALDVVLNRLELDQSTQLAQSLRALEGIGNAIARVRARGYEVVLAGMPGDGQSGNAVIASTLPLQRATTAFDIAPTLLEVLGFPLSNEMPGRPLLFERSDPRIASYGNRTASGPPPQLNDEYYENLKSLGYIR